MDLSEFREELGDVLFHRFFDENFKTVRDVLQASKEDIMNTLAIEPDKVDEIIAMLRKGLEDAEVENDDDANELIAELNASIDTKKEEPEGESAASESPAPASDAKEKTEEHAS